MSPGDVAMTMTAVGIVGIVAAGIGYESGSRKLYWSGIAWFAFWAGPPLMQLWIKGVLG